MVIFGLTILICCVTTLAANTGRDLSISCSRRFSHSLWPYTADLLKNLEKSAGPEDNVLISPISSYLALSTVYLGIGEGNRSDFATILRITPDNSDATDCQFFSIPESLKCSRINALESSRMTESNLHDTLAHVIEDLYNKPTDLMTPDSKAELASGLFVQNNFPVRDAYKTRLKDYYNGTASNVDFTDTTNGATDLINTFGGVNLERELSVASFGNYFGGWVAEKTLGRIAKFFTEPIERSTAALLLSTLYFNGRWKKEFSKSQTKEEKFSVGSTEINTPMMSRTDFLQYESNPSLRYDAIAIPYIGEEFFMTVLLPHRSQTVNNLTDHLHLIDPLSFTHANGIRRVDYKIPKMKFNWNKSLLEALNAQSIFENLDLSALTSEAVKISKIVHAAEIEVDEDGTVASAVTGVQVVPLSGFVSLEKTVQLYVDRPFLFNIVHKPTCTVLFTGKVYKPIV